MIQYVIVHISRKIKIRHVVLIALEVSSPKCVFCIAGINVNEFIYKFDSNKENKIKFYFINAITF